MNIGQIIVTGIGLVSLISGLIVLFYMKSDTKLGKD